MEVVNFTFVLSILFTAIPVLHSLTYDECSRRTEQCLLRFNGMNKGNMNLCREGTLAVQCVRALDCPSMMYRLISFRHVLRTLYDDGVVRCELGNFLQDFPYECGSSQDLRSCLATYTDRIIAHTSRGLDNTAVCQDMNDYVTCQLDWDSEPCNVTRTNMRAFLDIEKTRMGITECEIPGLNRAGLAGQVSLLVISLTTVVSLLVSGSIRRA